MKPLLSVALCAVLLLSLCACGIAPEKSSQKPPAAPSSLMIEASITPSATAEVLTPTPTQSAVSPSPALDAFTQDDAAALFEKLARDMWTPYVNLEPFAVPDYVEDTPSTHLAMRWPEYYLAYLEKHPNRRLVSIDSVDGNAGPITENPDATLTFAGMAEIRFTRVDAETSGVNGVNVEYALTLNSTENEPKIVAIDMLFATDYRRLKEEVERRAEGEEPTIAMIDSVVDTAIRNIK